MHRGFKKLSFSLHVSAPPRAERCAILTERTRSGLPQADRCCGRRSRPHARFGIAETRGVRRTVPTAAAFCKVGEGRAGRKPRRGSALDANRFIP